MTSHMVDLISVFARDLNIKGPVLEIGSFIEPVQLDLNLRQAFPTETYHGVDVVQGDGVDEIADLRNRVQMLALSAKIKPNVILCLYVLEHVWEIVDATKVLGAMWKRNPEAWLFVATHQNQPYHGHMNMPDRYDDYWRVTQVGMRRLMDEAGIAGGRLFLYENPGNPEDVLLIRQPSSAEWPGEKMEESMRTLWAHWEVR